ncbi:MAG TPA: hypothetical protein VK886_17445 [Vicinamibacterales bacterium]|nr:hypothetical protein [Vicinamibacterales bacterium]
MTQTELKALLEEFYRDKLALRNRHVAAARLVTDYDTNNTYQYVIAREDVQLSWLRATIEELSGNLAEVPEPEVRATGKRDEAERAILTEDRDLAARFVERWSGRVEAVTHARHRGMLRVILGETVEHKRFFELALAGRDDLLGRRMDGAGTGGGVLPSRWIE